MYHINRLHNICNWLSVSCSTCDILSGSSNGPTLSTACLNCRCIEEYDAAMSSSCVAPSVTGCFSRPTRIVIIITTWQQWYLRCLFWSYVNITRENGSMEFDKKFFLQIDHFVEVLYTRRAQNCELPSILCLKIKVKYDHFYWTNGTYQRYILSMQNCI